MIAERVIAARRDTWEEETHDAEPLKQNLGIHFQRGAKVIHVDPRFTRTSAMADLHVAIRPGTDIAFLGGIINYIFQHDAWFEQYVRHYTNGPVIIKPEFQDTDQASGFFSGWNPAHSAYAISTWGYNKTSGEATAGKQEQLADVSGEQAHGA